MNHIILLTIKQGAEVIECYQIEYEESEMDEIYNEKTRERLANGETVSVEITGGFTHERVDLLAFYRANRK